MRIDLLVVSIETTVANVVDTSRHATGDHAGDKIEVTGKWRAIIPNRGFVFGCDFKNRLRADAGIESDTL